MTKKKNGYIFPEVLIAVSILMIALTPIMGMYIMALKNTANSLNRTTAIFLAQGKMEELKSIGHLNGALIDSKKLNGVIFNREVSVQDYKLNPVNLVWVNVVVNWHSGGQDHQVSLATYFDK
jgi:hypothetical protein